MSFHAGESALRQMRVFGMGTVAVQSLSHVQLFATPWTVVFQPPPSMQFSKQEYCSGLLFPSPGDLLDPGIKLMSLESPAWVLYHVQILS